MNRHFFKEIQTTKKYMKRCSTSFAIREPQIKISVRYQFTPTRMANRRRKIITSVSEDVEKLEPSNAVGRNIKW